MFYTIMGLLVVLCLGLLCICTSVCYRAIQRRIDSKYATSPEFELEENTIGITEYPKRVPEEDTGTD